MSALEFQNHSAPVISVCPLTLSSPGREPALQVRVSAPVTGDRLPVILFSHGFGSSMDGYAPLVNFWAAHGFVVIQPTFLDSDTLSANPGASHDEAVKAYLADPRKIAMWRYRVEDVKRVLDQIESIVDAVPDLGGRIDPGRIAAVGHSFGAQTTAMLLGARVLDAEGNPEEALFDARIKAGVLLSAGGRGGDALTQFAKENFPHLNQSYAEMKTRTLVVAGDRDDSPLTNLGPRWFTDAYTLSPGAEALVTLFGGEHMLGGISGHLVTETTDENPARVAAVLQLTLAYLKKALYPEDQTWAAAIDAFKTHTSPLGRLDVKSP